VIYLESVRRIIRDTPPEQGDTLFAGSEAINGFQNAQFLMQCIVVLAQHKTYVLKATMSDLTGTGTLNHQRDILQESKCIFFLGVRLFIAFKMPNYCSNAGMHRCGNNWAF
jgi:hypothetical protein